MIADADLLQFKTNLSIGFFMSKVTFEPFHKYLIFSDVSVIFSMERMTLSSHPNALCKSVSPQV